MRQTLVTDSAPKRVGLIVPSSNVTVETELPRILSGVDGVEFTFHASRMRMHAVTPEQLRAMNAQRERCVLEVGDAGVDTILYACLVAIMATGLSEHRNVEMAIAEQLATGGSTTKVLSSAGALVKALRDIGAKRVGLVMPYMKPLAQQVVAYIENEGFEVAGWRALEVADNAEVGCIAPERILQAARSLDLRQVDALVLSACVQMPSLSIVEAAERELGVPVLSAATAGAYCILRSLDVPVNITGAGSLLRADAVLRAV
ncbi:maleate cis-trans isomerase [Antrihabitans sp. YC2-6]|uniref:maleate cis-trans isomerase family protein n=1 Tax=Antrihabitans sp. YC2-6 TaxID=2799498 RepID=UPI0018F6F2E3|nr:maleate cis-trans isomerase [Antrihabitans sp. YC2-6]MBJ8348246.1 maleate cis-trans isomerase [Antrihabitans sp. YC2-6]